MVDFTNFIWSKVFDWMIPLISYGIFFRIYFLDSRDYYSHGDFEFIRVISQIPIREKEPLLFVSLSPTPYPPYNKMAWLRYLSLAKKQFIEWKKIKRETRDT